MKLVFVEKLKRGMITAEDVYPPANSTVPYVRKDTVLTDLMISEMQRLNIRFAYIRLEKISPKPHLSKKPVLTRSQPILTPQLRTQAVGSLEDLFVSVNIRSDAFHTSAQIVKQLDSVVNHLVDTIQRDSGMLVNINDLKSYDEYTYHHSLSVAVLSIAIAQNMGFNRAGLKQIGMCAIMHDIGKTAVPLDIINKPSRLNDEEFAVIKSHSPAGFDYLRNEEIGGEEIWKGVLHHHERLDGNGYPDGIKGNDIPLFSRIISVADVYDALTSNRPYRKPMQPAEAIEYIMGGVGSAFDYDVVMSFIQKVELYPIDSLIQLSNGKRAIVLNNEHSMRPVIKLESGEIVDLYRDRKCLNLVISKLLA